MGHGPLFGPDEARWRELHGVGLSRTPCSVRTIPPGREESRPKNSKSLSVRSDAVSGVPDSSLWPPSVGFKNYPPCHPRISESSSSRLRLQKLNTCADH